MLTTNRLTRVRRRLRWIQTFLGRPQHGGWGPNAGMRDWKAGGIDAVGVPAFDNNSIANSWSTSVRMKETAWQFLLTHASTTFVCQKCRWETSNPSKNLSSHVPPLYHFQTYRTFNPQPNQPDSWKHSTSGAGGVSQGVLNGESTSSHAEHRTSIRVHNGLRRYLSRPHGSLCGLQLKLQKVLASQPLVNFILEHVCSRWFCVIH